MKWAYLMHNDIDEFIDKEAVLKKVKSVELIIDDDGVTGVVVEFKDENLLHFCSRHVDSDGQREELVVSTTKGIDDVR